MTRLSPRVVLFSAALSLQLRVRGICTKLVRCDGWLPVIYAGGRISIAGGLSVRGRASRAEFGAHRGGLLALGEGVYINQGASIVASKEIRIGDRTRIGDYAAIHDSDYHAVDPAHPKRIASVHIGSDVWIGRGAIIMPGVSVGSGAVIAAGAVVTHDVPPAVLVAGVPASVVRNLELPNGWRRD
jgi:acetyltransferase-like isoleucine patch superfamily enzyme